MGIEADAALGADAAPLAGQQRAAEQVGPDRHAVEAPFVLLRPDAGEDPLSGKSGSWVGAGRSGAGFPGFGHNLPSIVSDRAAGVRQNRLDLAPLRAADRSTEFLLLAAFSGAGASLTGRPRLYPGGAANGAAPAPPDTLLVIV